MSLLILLTFPALHPNLRKFISTSYPLPVILLLHYHDLLLYFEIGWTVPSYFLCHTCRLTFVLHAFPKISSHLPFLQCSLLVSLHSIIFTKLTIQKSENPDPLQSITANHIPHTYLISATHIFILYSIYFAKFYYIMKTVHRNCSYNWCVWTKENEHPCAHEL